MVYSETGIFGVLKTKKRTDPKIQVYACGVAMKMNNLTENELELSNS